MSPANDLARAVLVALDRVDGVRPSTPSAVPAASWIPWDWNMMAVDIGQDAVRVQVVATQLPLPAVLQQANKAIRAVMGQTAWADARLQLVVTDIDRAAFKRDSHHTNFP